MGHKKKNSDNRDLHQQAYDKLKSMQSFGESKLADKRNDRDHDTDTVLNKIYSYSSYKTYWKHIKYFLGWLQKHHPEIKRLDKARRYVSVWLQTRVEENKSAWTIQTEAAALNKLFGIKKDDPDRFKPPTRHKDKIVRSRGSKIRDRHFAEEKNKELVDFCKSCGFRRNVLERLKGSDLLDRKQIEDILKKARYEDDRAMIKACKDALESFDEEFFILHRNDKGGKTRISPIVGDDAGRIVERMKNTDPNKRVWIHVSGNCDVHGYRADYATMLYKKYARPIEELSYNRKIKCADGKYRSEIYVNRGSDKGKKLDRRALRIVSIALGHNREDTAIANYIRDI